MAQQNSPGSDHALHPTERQRGLATDQTDHPTNCTDVNGSPNQNSVYLARLIADLEPGHRALEQGDLAAAIDQYQQVLVAHPDSPEVYQVLAEALSLQGQLAESAACYRTAIELLTQSETVVHNTPQTTGATVETVEASVEVEDAKVEDVEVEELCTLLQAAEAACIHQQWQVAIDHCRRLIDLQPSAKTYKLMGNALQAGGAKSAAMQSYRAALQLQPGWAEVHANLGSLHAQQQQWAEAIAAYEQALHLKPNFAGAYRNLARIWTQLKQTEQATRCWYQALRLEPNYASAQEHAELGNQLLAQGEAQAAIDCYREAIQQNPDFATAHQNLAMALMQVQSAIIPADVPANQLIAVGNRFGAAVTTPSSATQWVDLGTFYVEQQQWNHAITAYRTALSLDADLPKIHQQLGHALKQQGEAILAEAWNCYQQAIQIDPNDLQNYHAAIDLNPDDTDLYYKLANALERQGDMAGSITFRQVASQILDSTENRILNEQQTVDDGLLNCLQPQFIIAASSNASCNNLAQPYKPEDAAESLQRGRALQQQGHLDEAIKAYHRATQLDPQSAEGFHQLGNLLLKQQQWSDAADAYRRAIQLAPQDCWSHQGLADAAMQLEQWKTAAAAYEQAAQLNPTFFWSRQGLADACMKLEQWEKGAAAYQQAIQQKNDFYWSHYNLGEAFTKLERWDEAVIAFRQALSLEPSASVYRKLGDALQKQTHPDLSAAFDCYQQAIVADPHELLNYHKAIELQPQNAQLYRQLADALQQQNQEQQAILFYQMALQLHPTDAAVKHRLAELTQTTASVTALLETDSTKVSIHPVATIRPKFSVVVPIYDRTQLLYEALISICRQTCTDFEVLLVLDGSPQATVEVAQQFLEDTRFRMYSYPEASGNACRGRNRGILEAKGDYIALLDSDDLATPDRLAVTLAAFDQNDCDAVVGKAQYLILENRPNLSVNTLSENQVVPLIYSVLKRVNPIVTSTISIRRDVLLKYGGFRPEMRYREDHELWLRLIYHGCRMVYVGHRFAQYRLHKTNNELNFKAQDRHWIDLMHQSYHQPFSHWGV